MTITVGAVAPLASIAEQSHLLVADEATRVVGLLGRQLCGQLGDLDVLGLLFYILDLLLLPTWRIGYL